jgi:putative membrane protein
MDMMWGMWGMMGWMIVPWLLLIAAVAVGVWWLVRQRAPRHDRALETLRERYARGEITREEFEARRRDLAA